MSDFEKLKKTLLKQEALWEDSEFPALQTSVFYHKTPPFDFVWKRPGELSSNPVFLPENPNRSFELTAGKLGDRWFLSTIGCLSVTKGLFFRVVPADQTFDSDEYAGVFRFRIFWFNEWREVLVDDRLPTVNGKLVFMHSRHGDHFWASLLEKAYAKLYGSYEALKYTNSLDGMSDFTGGLAESINIRSNPTGCSPLINRLLTKTSIITAVNHPDHVSESESVAGHTVSRPKGDKDGSGVDGAEGGRCGPGRGSSGESSSGASSGSNVSANRRQERTSGTNGHIRSCEKKEKRKLTSPVIGDGSILAEMNYRVMAIERVELTGDADSIQLVKLRSPLVLLGSSSVPMEPDGPWSRRSHQWDQVPAAEKERIKFSFTSEGDFWMSFVDFVKTFTHLEVIHLETDLACDEPSLRSKQAWTGRHWRGVWRRGVTAGGCRNHSDTFPINTQLYIHLMETQDVVISLAQDSVLEPKVIGFSLYTLPSSFGSLDAKLDRGFFRRNRPLISSSYCNSKEVALRIPGLESGSYAVIPTTYEPGQEGPFAIRILTGLTMTKIRALDCPASVLKPAIVSAPGSFDSKFVQYEALFLQISDEHKSVNAFELQELLEACLPNDYVKSCATLDVARLIISAVSSDQSFDLGRLRYSEFKNIMCSLRYWQSIFKNHTKGTSGILRAEKLREALYDIGFQLNSDILSPLVLRYIRRDGTLRFGDFVSCVLHLAICFQVFQKRDPNDTGSIKMSLPEWIRHSLRS